MFDTPKLLGPQAVQNPTTTTYKLGKVNSNLFLSKVFLQNRLTYELISALYFKFSAELKI